MRSARTFFTHAIAATRIVVRDGRIPGPLRWGAGFAVLPIPGPVDEVVLVLVAGTLWLFYRDQLRQAWRQSDPKPAADG